MKKIRILLADDHGVVRRALRLTIESEEGWEVCGEAATGEEAVQQVRELQPDLLVIDVGMPDLNGIEALQQIKRLRPDLEVLVFTGSESETLFHQVLAAGALGCVLKADPGEQVVPALRSLLKHEPYFSPRVSQAVFQSYLKGGVQAEAGGAEQLTNREREIVRLLSDGHSNKETAAKLGISVATVETHRATVMKKLHFKAFSELVRYAVRNHLVQD